jgi:hypothetical protein
MKEKVKALIFCLLIATACNPEPQTVIIVQNDSEIARIDEVLTIAFEDFTEVAGDIPPGKFPFFLIGSDTLTSQLVDTNLDGIPEKILVSADVPARDFIKLSIAYCPSDKYPRFKPKTNIRFAKHDNYLEEIETDTRVQSTLTEVTSKIYQMEGPAWENEKVGFRNYFDLRNGNDIFGKLVPDMVLDYVGQKNTVITDNGLTIEPNYHVRQTWGMDVLKVGTSLGAGAIGLMTGDSLYRIGDNGSGTFTRVYEGPLQSSIRFDFPNWKAAEKEWNISQTITITAGEYCFHSSVEVMNPDTGAYLVTGIVNKHSDALYSEKTDMGSTLLLTHANQAEDSSMLSMGLMIPQNCFGYYAEAPKTGGGITETYYAVLKPTDGNAVEYRFYAFWAPSDPRFEEMSFVLETMRRDAAKTEQPLLLKSEY